MYNEFLQEVIQLNFLPLCIILFLIVFLCFNDSFEHRLTVLFIPPLVMILMLVIVDNLDYYLLNIRYPGLLHVATAVVGYNLRIFIMLSLIFVALRNSKTLIYKRILLVLAVVNMGFTILAFFTKLVFWYGENGEINRGPLAYTTHITFLVYALFLVFYSVWIMMYGRKNEGIIIIMTVVLTFAGTLVENMYQLRGILVGVIAMNIIFYYLYIHIEHYKVDVLTGALNRGSFLADTGNLTPEDNIYVISVDLNDLKKVNDTMGHLTGDEAIKSVAIGIRKALDSYLGRCKIYRVGGDEFVVICRGITKSDIEKIMSSFENRSESAKYSFSAGWAHWGNGETFDTVYERADKAMYEKKQSFHLKHEQR